MTGGVAGYENTHGVVEERREVTGTLSAEPSLGDYRIRYYSSSDKLKTVD
jgi:hypothetical protein